MFTIINKMWRGKYDYKNVHNKEQTVMSRRMFTIMNKLRWDKYEHNNVYNNEQNETRKIWAQEYSQ